jgi:HAD superfamily hydrolase (TIGR01509 family)
MARQSLSRPAAIIFDFDGVLADSELPANHALAESLTAIGLPTSFEDSIRDYYGHNWQETERRIAARLGGPLPVDFRDTHRTRARAHFAKGFAPVPGATAFLDRSCDLPRAVASSSNPDYIRWALARFELSHHFGDHVFSADGMERGKPHPDIYLKAAHGLGVAAPDCMAIEDSPTGAMAAVAAGMHVIGLCAAGHITDRAAHADALRAVGVHRIAFGFEEIALLSARHLKQGEECGQ